MTGSALVVGLALWGLGLVLSPAPLAARILLIAPLVVIPKLMAVLPPRPGLARVGAWVAIAAAAPLLIAISMPAGLGAATFALPWLAIAGFAAIAGLVDAIRRLAGLRSTPLQPALAEFVLDAALGFWVIGAVFLVVDRLGVPTPYPPAIVLLTATHFHVAGMGLVALAGLLARSRPAVTIPAVGLVAGIPITALGFILPSAAIGAVGAVVVGASGIGVGLGFLAGAEESVARWARRVAGLALLVGMPLGIGWSVTILVGSPYLDLDTMIRTHGVLNATAVVLAAVTWPDPA
jgi:hypothetical protein